MPDALTLRDGLARHRRRLRLAAALSSVAIGGILACAVLIGSAATGLAGADLHWSAATAFVVSALPLATYWWRRSTFAEVARLIESRTSHGDNLVVTAEEVLRARGRAVHPVVRDALLGGATERLRRIAPGSVQSLARPLALAALSGVTLVLALIVSPPAQVMPTASHTAAGAAAPLAIGSLRVVVTPPAYTSRGTTSEVDPVEVVVIEGSRVRLETGRPNGPVEVALPGRAAVPFVLANGVWAHEFAAVESQALLIRRSDGAETGDADHLLQLRVTPDRRPLVRIRSPAKDLIFSAPMGQVPIEIEAADDLGLASLTLRYTRVAGSGETFTFEEGEAPVRIERSGAGEWNGSATLHLESLRLGDGDTLVYRALATDRKPGADPSASDSFLIEIGRLSGVASTGFALPEDRERQAISQQMLIIKTERLHAGRSSLSREAYLEQSRLLAIEQRMVKAEFVFMTGGEVVDEVEEAAHAHDLAEGRLENAAQIELLTAIREMSRAEARLNAADTAEALTYERAALRALQRAFDRRRYLLRTLPERTRIDAGRRLTGDRSEARAPRRPAAVTEPDATASAAREVLGELGAAVARREGMNAGLAARVLAIDPDSLALQQVAAKLSAAPRADDRVEAAREAQRLVGGFLQARLVPGADGRIVDDPLRGRFADEVARQRGRR